MNNKSNNKAVNMSVKANMKDLSLAYNAHTFESHLNRMKKRV
jgi:hypothetical protein